MAQWVKELVTKHDDLSSAPHAHTTERPHSSLYLRQTQEHKTQAHKEKREKMGDLS